MFFLDSITQTIILRVYLSLHFCGGSQSQNEGTFRLRCKWESKAQEKTQPNSTQPNPKTNTTKTFHKNIKSQDSVSKGSKKPKLPKKISLKINVPKTPLPLPLSGMSIPTPSLPLSFLLSFSLYFIHYQRWQALCYENLPRKVLHIFWECFFIFSSTNNCIWLNTFIFGGFYFYDTDKEKHGIWITVSEEGEEVQWGIWGCVQYGHTSQRAWAWEGTPPKIQAPVSTPWPHPTHQSKSPNFLFLLLSFWRERFCFVFFSLLVCLVADKVGIKVMKMEEEKRKTKTH